MRRIYAFLDGKSIIYWWASAGPRIVIHVLIQTQNVLILAGTFRPMLSAAKIRLHLNLLGYETTSSKLAFI
jgi:hypothetical protein